MAKIKPDIKEALLDIAWDITHDSVIYNVIDDTKELTDEEMNQAQYKIRYIDKNDWFPIAKRILKEKPFVKDFSLAELASSEFINDNMHTKYLKVTFDGY